MLIVRDGEQHAETGQHLHELNDLVAERPEIDVDRCLLHDDDLGHYRAQRRDRRVCRRGGRLCHLTMTRLPRLNIVHST
jgi:hypothetical protein